jgi:hypothetical protein
VTVTLIFFFGLGDFTGLSAFMVDICLRKTARSFRLINEKSSLRRKPVRIWSDKDHFG